MKIALRMVLMLLILGGGSMAARAEGRFVDNGDGTVTDKRLNLMWSAADNHGDINWHQAVKWVRYTFPDTLTNTYENWRLPTLAELHSLAGSGHQEGYEAECGQRLKLTSLIRLSCGLVWSADSDILASSVYVFNFDNIYHYSVRTTHRRGYRALAVRDLDAK